MRVFSRSCPGTKCDQLVMKYVTTIKSSLRVLKLKDSSYIALLESTTPDSPCCLTSECVLLSMCNICNHQLLNIMLINKCFVLTSQ